MSDVSSFADLSNRTAVVTGSSSGIGRAIAIELARAGADLILHYHQNRAGANETAETIRKLGQSASVLQADISNETQSEQLVEEAFSQARNLEIWINNAGVDVLTGEAKDWPFSRKLERLLAVDVIGTINLSRIAGRRFVEQKKGCILNIGWDQAERGMEGDSGELFATSKNAIMGFTRSLALSLAPDVRANCIAPGWIQTAWGASASSTWQERVMRETPLQRWGFPEDIARLARFLCSDEAAYLTGQIYYANGGAER